MDSEHVWPQKGDATSSLVVEPAAATSLPSPTRHRAPTRREFSLLKTKGRRHTGISVRFQYIQADGPIKFGITAFKSGGNAVQRNRFKRVVREAARRVSVPAGLHLQVLPLLPLEKISYQSVTDDLIQLCTSIQSKNGPLKP